ncbi:MAG: sulfate adenylyltransferase subunit 1 [Bradymonadia bacterium]
MHANAYHETSGHTVRDATEATLEVTAEAGPDATAEAESISRLRFITAGSVDDGKSTLIGRLLYDSKSLFDDQVAALEKRFDLARLTDGLRAEREQGITIDVAWRYFATPHRRFVIADCPGHVQYTRNMITGASHAEVAVLLVDARHGVVEQTRRHAFIAARLGLSHIVFCVNKMDLVDFDEGRFDTLEAELEAMATTLGVPAITVLPISALEGDNVVSRSPRTPWYDGPALLELLERIEVVHRPNLGPDAPARLPVQVVIRPEEDGRPEDRRYAGTVASGTLNVGDEVVVLPSGQTTRISAIDTFDGGLQQAVAGEAVAVGLADVLDVGRGAVIAPVSGAPTATQSLTATVCWMGHRPLTPGSTWVVQHGTTEARCKVAAVDHQIDLETLQPAEASQLALNDLGRVRLKVSVPLAADGFTDVQATGRFIIIDPSTHETVGAALVE